MWHVIARNSLWCGLLLAQGAVADPWPVRPASFAGAAVSFVGHRDYDRDRDRDGRGGPSHRDRDRDHDWQRWHRGRDDHDRRSRGHGDDVSVTVYLGGYAPGTYLRPGWHHAVPRYHVRVPRRCD
jgi:hypothetical protein